MAYTFNYQDTSGGSPVTKTTTSETDLRQTAGGSRFTLVEPTPIQPTQTTPITPQANTQTTQTPLVNTNPTNQVSTGQNTRIKVSNTNGLAGLTETDLVREGQDIYLKPSALSKINMSSGNYQQVNTPITSSVDIPNTLSQNTFSSINSPSSLNDLQNKIAQGQDAYNQALNQFSTMATYDPLVQYNQAIEQSGVMNLQKQLADTDNALRNLDDDIRSRYAGRDITESQLQALVAKESEPILRSRQYLADQVNSVLSSIENQVQLGQQGFTNKFNQTLQVLGLKKDTLADLKTELNNQLELARTGRLDEINLAMTLAQLPKDYKVTLSDGSVLQGGGMIEKNVSQIQETDANGRVTISFIDTNPDSETFGQVIKTTDLGIISKPQSSGGGSGGYTPQELRKLRANNIDPTDIEKADKFLYTDETSDVSQDVSFYVNALLNEESTYIDEEGNIQWQSIPQDLRPEVQAEFDRRLNEQPQEETTNSGFFSQTKEALSGGLNIIKDYLNWF